MPLLIEHLVGPPRNDHPVLQERVRERVEEEVARGGQVFLLDFAWTINPCAPEPWRGCVAEENLVVHQPDPEERREAVKILYTMCLAGVSLVVVHEPNRAHEMPWLEILSRLRTGRSDSVLLAVNSFRVKEASMEEYDGFEPWSSLADREEVLNPWRQ